MSAQTVLSQLECRRLLLSAQGLCDDPARPATPDTLYHLIENLGFVQIDSINVLARAHHLTLFSRLDGYQPAMLTHLTEVERRLFEHWTHDASFIPTVWFRYWRHRFARYGRRIRRSAWWQARLGQDPDTVIAQALQRVGSHGPLRSSDFDSPKGDKVDAWWSWKPHKAALEHLWRSGHLAVKQRHNFQKVYDLTERVFPAQVQEPAVSEPEYIAWACESALHRLGAATSTELAHFWHGVTLVEARQWCETAVREGRVCPVRLQERSGVAVLDWQARASRAPSTRLRLLCPFDPILRDRQRLERLFDFSYRFEAFVPASGRQHGYYVLPILDGEVLVGRLDAKVHRSHRTLEVKGLWWERGQKVGVRRQRALKAALERLAAFVGAETVTRDQGV